MEQLVVGRPQPLPGVRIAAPGNVFRVCVGVGRQRAGQHGQAGDEPVGVGDVLAGLPEPFDQRLLVLAVPRAHARALDLERRGDRAAVDVQEHPELVRAEAPVSQWIRPTPGGGRMSTSRAVQPGPGLHGAGPTVRRADRSSRR